MRNYRSVLIPTVIIAAVAIVGVISVTSMMRQRQDLAELENAKDKGSLKWYAKVAKAQGKSRITRPGPEMGQYVDSIKDLDTALSLYTVLVAQPVEKKSLVEAYNRVITFYRFKVLENISQKQLRQCQECTTPEFVPGELLPVLPDEILIADVGGTVTVDGVEITEPTRFGFEPSERYLLFVKADPSGTFGEIRVGPKGSFRVNPDETLTPLVEDGHPLQRFMKELKDSLRGLRKEVETKAADR